MLFILGALIFSYTALRACLLSITVDEAYTYLEFVRKGLFFPAQFDRMSANNHLLNTWMEIYLVKAFGSSEFVLRIPALLGHLLFLFFSARLLKEHSPLLRTLSEAEGWRGTGGEVSAFLIINLNPYMLDFFSLARGYGISLGFLVASVFYLFEFQKKNKNFHAMFTIAFAALASLANFSMMNFCIASFGIIILMIGYNTMKLDIPGNKKIISLMRRIILPTIIMIVLSGIIFPHLYKLKEAGALYYGGTIGFWTDTLCESITISCYGMNYGVWLERVAKALVLLTIVAAPVFAGLKYYKKQTQNNTLFLGSLLLLIALPATFSIIQHYFAGVPYLVHRTALPFLPLFNILFVFFILELSKVYKNAASLMYFTTVLAMVNFAYSFNLKYVADWKVDADTKEMVSDLEEIMQKNHSQDSMRITGSALLTEGLDYYKSIKQLSGWSIASTLENTGIQSNYFYLTPADFSRTEKGSMEIIKTYPTTKNILGKQRETKMFTKSY